MHGYDVPDPTDRLKSIGDLNVGRSPSKIATDQPRESEIWVDEGNVKNVDPNSLINNVSL